MNQITKPVCFVALALVLVTAGTGAWADDIDRARELMDDGWLDDAETVLNGLLSQNPDRAEVYYELARVYLIRDDAQASNGGAPWDNLDKIEDYAEKAIELDPDAAQYYVVYGHAVGLKAMRGGKVKMFSRAKSAKSRYETAAEMDPTNIEARTSLIQYHMQAPGIAGGDKDEARRLAAAVAALDSAEGYGAWKSVYLHAEEYEALEAAIGDVIESAPEEARGYLELARLCFRREDYECARENLKKVLSIDPEEVDAYWYLDQIYRDEGRSEDARAALEQAVAAKPEEGYVYRWVGDFYRDEEQWEEAVQWYRRALEADPEYARALYSMGKTYVLSNSNLDRAVECFNEYLASRLNCWWPEPALAHCQLARIYAELGDKKAAKSEVKKAKKLNPKNDEVRQTAKKLHIR